MVTANDLYDCVVDGVYSFTTDQLIGLQDLISGTIEVRENEWLGNLQAKAINALKEYLNAGGGIDYEDNIIFRIDEDHAWDNDYNYIHLK